MVRLSAVIAGTIALALATPASAMICGKYEDIQKQIETRKGEVHGLGITTDGKGLVELYTRPQRGWVIVLTSKDKLSCVLLQGRDWADENTPDPAADVPSDPTLPEGGEHAPE